MSRAKVFISILMVLILIALSGVSACAVPGGQGPTPEPTEEPTVEPTEEPAVEPTEEPAAEPTREPAIAPGDVMEDDKEDGEEAIVHPVASALAEFFADTPGLDYDEIMGYHKSGTGFGTLAQACWMSSLLEGEVTVGDILAAKKSHDFSSIELPGGGTAKNWGQFKKAVLSSDKAKKNLGTIMSGRSGKGKGKGGGKGKGKD